jgi:hypothetical protein
MRDVRVAVEVEMRRSNGDYGWDQAMCQVSGTLDADEGIDDIADWLLDRAARNVEGRLSRSASLEVRRTMLRTPRLCNECHEPLGDDETGYLHPACKLAEDAEREERYQAAKRRNEEQEQQQDERELVATRDGDDEDLPL